MPPIVEFIKESLNDEQFQYMLTIWSNIENLHFENKTHVINQINEMIVNGKLHGIIPLKK